MHAPAATTHPYIIQHARSTWLLKTVAGAGRPCLFVGDSGTNKSVTISAFLAGLEQSKYTSAVLGFSSRTSSMDVQRAVEDCLEKRTKANEGPWGGSARAPSGKLGSRANGVHLQPAPLYHLHAPSQLAAGHVWPAIGQAPGAVCGRPQHASCRHVRHAAAGRTATAGRRTARHV